MRSKEEVLNEVLKALNNPAIEQAPAPILEKMFGMQILLLSILPEVLLDIRDLLKRYVDILERIDNNDRRLNRLVNDL